MGPHGSGEAAIDVPSARLYRGRALYHFLMKLVIWDFLPLPVCKFSLRLSEPITAQQFLRGDHLTSAIGAHGVQTVYAKPFSIIYQKKYTRARLHSIVIPLSWTPA